MSHLGILLYCYAVPKSVCNWGSTVIHYYAKCIEHCHLGIYVRRWVCFEVRGGGVCLYVTSTCFALVRIASSITHILPLVYLVEGTTAFLPYAALKSSNTCWRMWRATTGPSAKTASTKVRCKSQICIHNAHIIMYVLYSHSLHYVCISPWSREGMQLRTCRLLRASIGQLLMVM